MYMRLTTEKNREAFERRNEMQVFKKDRAIDIFFLFDKQTISCVLKTNFGCSEANTTNFELNIKFSRLFYLFVAWISVESL